MAARKLNALVDRARASGGVTHVSAGTARLIAIAHVESEYPDEEEPVDTQSVAEPVIPGDQRRRLGPSLQAAGRWFEPGTAYFRPSHAERARRG